MKKSPKCPKCGEEMTEGYITEIQWYPEFIWNDDLWTTIKSGEEREHFWECFECEIKIPYKDELYE